MYICMYVCMYVYINPYMHTYPRKLAEDAQNPHNAKHAEKSELLHLKHICSKRDPHFSKRDLHFSKNRPTHPQKRSRNCCTSNISAVFVRIWVCMYVRRVCSYVCMYVLAPWVIECVIMCVFM